MKLTDDGQDVLFKMSPRLHYIVTALWALVTPALTSIVAKMFVEDNTAADAKELIHPGAPALEYFSMFLVFVPRVWGLLFPAVCHLQLDLLYLLSPRG